MIPLASSPSVDEKDDARDTRVEEWILQLIGCNTQESRYCTSSGQQNKFDLVNRLAGDRALQRFMRGLDSPFICHIKRQMRDEKEILSPTLPLSHLPWVGELVLSS